MENIFIHTQKVSVFMQLFIIRHFFVHKSRDVLSNNYNKRMDCKTFNETTTTDTKNLHTQSTTTPVNRVVLLDKY